MFWWIELFAIYHIILIGSVHSMADTLLDWFSSLASPVIPEKCTSKLEKGEKINNEFVKAFMNMVGWERITGCLSLDVACPKERVCVHDYFPA